MAHHLYFEPEPPRAYAPAIPRSLERLILWLLRKEPFDRPQSAREVIEAIDQIGWLAGDDRVSVQLMPEAGASVTTQTELSTASRVPQTGRYARSPGPGDKGLNPFED
jgi:hypothetical protein